MQKKRMIGLAVHGTLLFILFLTIYALFVMVISSLKTNIQIYQNLYFFSLPLHFEHYKIAFGQIYRSILNSLIITAGNVLLTLIISTLAGYAFARFQFKGKNLLFMTMMMMMMVPYFLILIPQFIISQKMHLLNTYAVQILPPSSAFAILSTFLITTHMESLPKSLFEMATIEGASDFKIFYYIALPLSKPILATVCITTLISSWNNYIWPLVSANAEKVRPVILQVSKVVASTYQMPGVNFAAYVIASVPLLLIFTVATKPFVEGLTAGAVKA